MLTTTPRTSKAEYHPAVNAILVRQFGPYMTVADLTRAADGHPAAIVIELLHANARRVEWAAERLETHITTVVNGLTSAARDLPYGLMVEVPTGTLRDIPALVATYHEALPSLVGSVATTASTFRTSPAASPISEAEASK